MGAIIFAFVPFASYLLASCWLFIFVAGDIAEDLQEFNVAVAAKTDSQSKTLTTHDEFCGIIQTHTDARQ